MPHHRWDPGLHRHGDTESKNVSYQAIRSGHFEPGCRVLAMVLFDVRRETDVVVRLVEIDVEQVEDDAVESRSQPVAQPTDPCDHSLSHACKEGSFYIAQ